MGLAVVFLLLAPRESLVEKEVKRQGRRRKRKKKRASETFEI